MSHELAKPRLITLVVNENSGGGRAGKAKAGVARALLDRIPTAELNVVSSESFADAENRCRAAAGAARPGDAVVVMGGDGMAHLGLNACAGTDATLGIVPAGTGNDFARGVGVPKSIPQAVDTIVAGRTRRVDLTRIRNGTHSERYVGAVVSSGYDARVNRATNDIQLRFGPLSYGYIALRELSHFDPLHYAMTVDGEAREFDAMLVAICNTGVFGGGMQISPDADPTDGWLDVTLVHPVSRPTLLRLLPQIYTGGFVKHPAVERFRARSVAIDGPGLFVMGDGEELGDVPVSIEVVPGALSVFSRDHD